jgi:pimeloyl-ACP methyl ester carboxylesterase
VEPVERASRTLVRVDVSDVAPPGCKEVALEVTYPAGGASRGATPDAILCCFPGGGMTRRYFDLAVPGYSFAEYASARGCLVVTVDHPGVGMSDAPDDGWTLTPQTLARVETAAVDRLLALLAAGDLGEMGDLAGATVTGVAHSAGALPLILQQVIRERGGGRRLDGLALLGWCGRGLPEYLDESDRALAELDDAAFGDELVSSARRRYPDPFPVLRRGSSRMLIASRMPPDVHQALVDVRGPLLAVLGHAATIPGSVYRATRQIEAPVFIGVGEHDIARDHQAIPAEFEASAGVTLFVLDGAGHNQNVEPGRARLWDRIIDWARSPRLNHEGT